MKRILTTTALATMIAGAAAAQDTTKDMIGTDGVIIAGDTVTFATVTASQDGYIVLHATKDGNVVAPASIGHTAIKAGENVAVTVASDEPLTEGTNFVAMLHVESNGNDTYDFAEGMTDVDTPAISDDAAVVQSFTATTAMMSAGAMMDSSMMPMINTMGVTIDGATATFANVMAENDGYLVIHAMLDGAPVVPASIGHVPVKAGANVNVAVTVDDDFVPGETYFAMLHEETNGNDTYDFGAGMTDVDTPAMNGDAVVGGGFGG